MLISRSLATSFDVCANVLAALTPILENSFTSSLSCCTKVRNALIFAKIALFAILVVIIILSAKLPTVLA